MNKSKAINVSKKLLMFLGDVTIAAGVMTLAVAAPGGMTGLIKLYNSLGKDKKLKTEQVRNSFNYLQRKKLVRFSYSSDKRTVKVKFSRYGLARFRIYKLEKFGIPKPKIWDQRWRVIMFDVPEKYRQGRDMLRSTIRKIGFFQLQKSVFVHPYPCEDEIEFVRVNYEIKPFVKMLVATDFEGIKIAKEFFYLTDS